MTNDASAYEPTLAELQSDEWDATHGGVQHMERVGRTQLERYGSVEAAKAAARGEQPD